MFAFPPRLLPKVFTFEVYTANFPDPEKLRFFSKSYLVVEVVTALTLFIANLTAYAFCCFN